jgi:hypothetical protein
MTYEVATTPSARPAPTDISVRGIVGFSEKGAVGVPIELNGPADLDRKLGDRPADIPYAWDTCDLHWKEAGSRAKIYFSRRVGPNPVKASKVLKDGAGSPLDTIKVEWNEYGADGDNGAIEVAANGSNRDFIVYYNDVEVERFTNIATRTAAAALAGDYVTFSATGTSTALPAVLAKTSLTGGDDDRANSTTTELEDALQVFGPELGPMELSSPGSTDSSSQALVAQYAADESLQNNRVAILDAPNTATISTITTAATAIRGGEYAAACMMVAPWVEVPGPLQGQTRTVPPSALAGGLMTRLDLASQPADVPAAGLLNGRSAAVTGLAVTSWTDDDRDTLNAAGVSAIRVYRNSIVMWGYRSLYDPDVDGKFVDFGPARLQMQIIAQLEAILELYILRRIDGKRHLLVDVNRDARAVMDSHVDNGSLEPQFDDDDNPIPDTEYSLTADADPVTKTLTLDAIFRPVGMVEDVVLRLIRRAHQENL